ncbi:hypothetical protein BDR06DRAFT_978246, partial [Suillus hirtellus]
ILSSEFQTPDTRDLAVLGLRYWVSGTRNSFRVLDTQNPRPETAWFRVSGVWNSELVKSISEFWTPDTQNLRPGSLGSRVSGVWNSELGMSKQKYIANMVPSSGHLKPETQQSWVLGFRGPGTQNSELRMGKIWGDQYNLIYNQTYRVLSSRHLTPETKQSQVLGFGCPELGTWGKFGEINTI